VGSGRDSYVGLATDLTSNSYVVGNTRSADFPVKSPLQATLASPDAADIFIIKLDPSGNVVYSTCSGGSGEDMASAVAIDPQGNLYVTGLTNSSDFPVTKGVFQSKIAWSSLSRASYSRPYFRCRRAESARSWGMASAVGW